MEDSKVNFHFIHICCPALYSHRLSQIKGRTGTYRVTVHTANELLERLATKVVAVLNVSANGGKKATGHQWRTKGECHKPTGCSASSVHIDLAFGRGVSTLTCQLSTSNNQLTAIDG